MPDLKTMIGLEIHVQLKTKSKMFCSCNNNAEGKAPNTLVCPVCLGLPGALPVANKQAIEWTIKMGLALDSKINKLSKFDRKHYFYPDLPKGYQISQYDEPFCVGGWLEVGSQESGARRIRLNRIHLEEDAGKLIHSGGKSLVDLNRAGTPLMEIVTEPDLTSPKEAGEFLRKLQKIVRDVAQVSEASMEKGHMRCDANISVSELSAVGGQQGEQPTADSKPQTVRMSPIVELKNINSFRFVEKALALVEEKLKAEYAEWPEKNSKETWGYDSASNKVYLQRRKEEAADYRYFPEPDLPPFDTSVFDLVALKADLSENEEEKIAKLVALGIAESDARVLASDQLKRDFYSRISEFDHNYPEIAKAIVHHYFPFEVNETDIDKAETFGWAISLLVQGTISKSRFGELSEKIHQGSEISVLKKEYESGGMDNSEVEKAADKIISENSNEVSAYKAGKIQLLGFFMGKMMKETGGKANAKIVAEILKKKLEG